MQLACRDGRALFETIAAQVDEMDGSSLNAASPASRPRVWASQSGGEPDGLYSRTRHGRADPTAAAANLTEAEHPAELVGRFADGDAAGVVHELAEGGFAPGAGGPAPDILLSPPARH